MVAIAGGDLMAGGEISDLSIDPGSNLKSEIWQIWRMKHSGTFLG